MTGLERKASMLFMLKSGKVLNTDRIEKIEPVDHSRAKDTKIDLMAEYNSCVTFDRAGGMRTEFLPDTVEEILQAEREESARRLPKPIGLA